QKHNFWEPSFVPLVAKSADVTEIPFLNLPKRKNGERVGIRVTLDLDVQRNFSMSDCNFVWKF
ncbi:MAG: hypothetical protein O3C21_20605, partial [Verrucomicrobia bacterium]|nr:hypothetical protein [Verrucomicrobiota bacterium]